MCREEIIPVVVEKFNMLPNSEKENSNMDHVFYGLHVIHNLGVYAKKQFLSWEMITEEQGNMHGGFIVTQKSQTYNLLFDVSKLLSKSHRDKKNLERLMNGRHI